MSVIVNMLEAKSSLSKLVDALEHGREPEFIIARNGRPAARLVPLQAGATPGQRRIGVAKGRFEVPDDIDVSNEAVDKLFNQG